MTMPEPGDNEICVVRWSRYDMTVFGRDVRPLKIAHTFDDLADYALRWGPVVQLHGRVSAPAEGTHAVLYFRSERDAQEAKEWVFHTTGLPEPELVRLPEPVRIRWGSVLHREDEGHQTIVSFLYVDAACDYQDFLSHYARQVAGPIPQPTPSVDTRTGNL